MNLLAVDTSTNRAVVVVCRRNGVDFESVRDPGLRHGRDLIPAIRDLLQAADLTLKDLDGFVVGVGPGSFTGLRVGVMAAKTLAYATDKPILGLDSLEIIAHGASVEAARIAVAADAQRGELFTADFRRGRSCATLRRDGPNRLESARDWLSRLEPGTLLVGPGLDRLKVPIPAELSRVATDHDALGRGLAALARETWRESRRSDLWTLEPVYVRPSAAEEKQNRGAASP